MPVRQYPDVRSRWLRRLAESGRSFTVIARNRALRRAELSFGGVWTAEWAFTVALGVVAFRYGGATAVGVVTFLRAAPAACSLRSARRWAIGSLATGCSSGAVLRVV